nr:hypothetical protein [uncultured Duganella sp.]
MKKALLILLMMVLPLQAFAAAERNLLHVLGGGKGHGAEFVLKHMAEHADHVAHHHHDDDDDDDGDATTGGAPHVDSSHKSLQHLADYEQGCGMNILLFAPTAAVFPDAVHIAPIPRPDVVPDRTTIPLLRPPRQPA